MNTEPFRAAVCDDEQADREKIIKLADKICEEENIILEIVPYDNAEALIQDLQKKERYHLLLLDVMMPMKNGMDLARQLRALKMDVSIVFVSSNREMALQGYEVSAVRYLAKPVEEERLREALLFCYAQSQKNRELFLPVSGGTRKVLPKDIFYVEIVGRKCRIFEKNEKWDVSVPMGKLEKLTADKGFIRCHQSFLVNFRHVRKFQTSSMELTDGRSVPVSKNRMKEVRKAFFDYMKK